MYRERNLLPHFLLFERSFMANHALVQLRFEDLFICEVRPCTIHDHLPTLWREWQRYFSPIIHLQFHLDAGCLNRYTFKVLHDLFNDLSATSAAEGRFTRLPAILELDYRFHGNRHALRKGVFFTLSRIFLLQNFGCSQKLWSILEDFVIRHAREISRVSQTFWIEFINVLVELDPYENFDLRGVLSCFIKGKTIPFSDLDYFRYCDLMRDRPFKVLKTLIERKLSQLYLPERVPPCLRCYVRLQRQEAFPRGYRDEWLYPWREDLEYEFGPDAQCGNCLSKFGPLVLARQLPPTPQHPLLLDAHYGFNYETEPIPARFFGDARRYIPRYMQPLPFHAARPRPPRQARRVAVRL